MTHRDAKRIATEFMKKHLEPGWFMKDGGTAMSLRGVQIKKAIADALTEAWHEGYAEGRRDEQQEL